MDGVAVETEETRQSLTRSALHPIHDTPTLSPTH